jgi:hypothetical protein
MSFDIVRRGPLLEYCSVWAFRLMAHMWLVRR